MWAAVRVTPCGYCPLTVCCFSPVLQSVVRMVALPSTRGPCPSDHLTRPTSYHLQVLPAPSLSCGELFAVIKFIMLLSFNSHTCQGGTAPHLWHSSFPAVCQNSALDLSPFSTPTPPHPPTPTNISLGIISSEVGHAQPPSALSPPYGLPLTPWHTDLQSWPAQLSP